MLAGENPKTVLAVGDGASAIAALAGRAGRQVVAMAREPAAVDAQFQAAEKGVLPVWMDIRYPTPGFGISSHELQPATERLACDAVVATGCVHRFAFENRLPAEHIATLFSDFAKKLLVVGVVILLAINVKQIFRHVTIVLKKLPVDAKKAKAAKVLL